MEGNHTTFRNFRTVALLGSKIAYSLSPVMHNTGFKALKLPFYYVPLTCGPDDLPKVMEAMIKLNFLGANVTWPYKESVIPFLKELSPEASRCRSVNTIKNEEGVLTGHSTDGEGFIGSCRFHGVSLDGGTALLFGAGGAARAVAFAVAAMGARHLILVNRTLSRAEELKSLLVKEHSQLDITIRPPAELSIKDAGEADVVINATSVGMKPDDPDVIPKTYLRPGQTVCDLIYAPLETRLMAEATEAGARALNGLAMLLFQGVASFRVWTGREAPIEIMSGSLCDKVGLPKDYFIRAN